ncbi:MAG: YbaB/EbfC family nucleoid-associated protein [Candidatus Berkelbacteria bacterium]|nr:YbaB/EbfC family nucleoid-associated protein [Candidatus Berkelbacteria bacterium]
MAFDKFKKLYDLQKKARQVQKDLRDTLIEAQSADRKIKVVFNAEQKIESIEIGEEYLTPDKKKELENTLMKVIQDATAKVQKVAAEKAKEMMGGIGLPGL